MSLTGSTEDLAQAVNAVPTCGICSNAIKSAAYMCKTVCGHFFHKSCYQKYSKSNQYCPLCHNELTLVPIPALPLGSTPPSAKSTRAQTQRQLEFDQHRQGNQNSPLGDSQESKNFSQEQANQITEMVSAAVAAQQSEILNTLSNQLTKVIESNMEAMFRRLNLDQSNEEMSQSRRETSFQNAGRTNGNLHPNPNPQMRTLPSVEQQTLEQLLGLPSTVGAGSTVPQIPGSAVLNTSVGNTTHMSTSSCRPDKVGHVIHNWKIKFSGEPNGMSVDNFIYRVEALTVQTLEGNFDLLCRHISTLFDSKATDWFWRYHRSVRDIRWPNLCKALRHQYKDSRTDVDFREMIRDRKQRPNEPFDSFYEAIVEIADRLSTPLAENVLVEILRRNLLPEIQHEILNLSIDSVSSLRDICRRREFFLIDIGKKQMYSKPLLARRQIHELVDNESESVDEDEISAVTLICWNCQKVGHRYQDCLEDRQIFCYGCGTPKIYKPNCTKCNNSKNGKSSALKSAHKQTHSAGTSTE